MGKKRKPEEIIGKQHYTVRPHSSFSYRPQAPETAPPPLPSDTTMH